MATSLEEGLKILSATVKTNRTHRDYKRVTELYEKYYKLITGDGIDSLMRRFVRREDDALFKQRCEYTQHVTASLANTIMAPFYKVGRVNVIKRSIDFETQVENFDAKKQDIDSAIEKYYGDKSLDKYLETRFVELQFCDPNSFIVTEFEEPERDAQGNPVKKVDPYPWEVTCEEAVDFKYKNNILRWLVIRECVSLEQQYAQGTGDKKVYTSKEEEAYNYTIYLENDAIKFTQVPFDRFTIPEDGTIYEVQIADALGNVITLKYIRFDTKRVFLVEEFNHKAGRVPAVRIGYKRDLSTKGRTFVSPMESGVPYFMKTIKAVSEMDLTFGLHVFPQKIQYVPRCVGESKEIGCDGGKTPAGTTCNICRGTGQMPAHTSAQDALFLRMPKDPKDMINLDSLMVYKSPPIDLIRFQNEYIAELKLEAQKAVFNSDVFSRAEISATATEKVIELDNVYDTLFPFAEKFADVWKYIALTIGALRDYNDVIVDYRFPKDFKFKSVDDLLGELKLANDANSPSYVKNEISNDIVSQQFVDKPEELKTILVKEKFFPFAGKSITEIIFIISNQKTTEYAEVLWSNFESIFLEIEMEQEGKNLYFYDMDYAKQKALVDEKVNALIENIKGAAPASSSVLPMQTEDPNNPGFDMQGQPMPTV